MEIFFTLKNLTRYLTCILGIQEGYDHTVIYNFLVESQLRLFLFAFRDFASCR